MTGRVIVVGAGAIGASTAAKLQRAGTPCVLVARGETWEAIAARGVDLRLPGGGERVKVPAVGSRADLAPTREDLVLLATMGQDTAAAVAGLDVEVPVVSLQNGLAPLETLAEQGRPVIAGMVYVPAERRGPGVVALPGVPVPGAFLLGGWPGGADARVAELAAWLADRLARAGYRAEAEPDIGPWIRAKLLVNLGGIVVALCDDPPGDVIAAAQDEARAVWAAGGERFVEVAALLDRVGPLETVPVDGRVRVGGSTRSALARAVEAGGGVAGGVGALETATLHGDVVDAGRRLGVPTPVNAALIALADRALRERWAPGSRSAAELRGAVGMVPAE